MGGNKERGDIGKGCEACRKVALGYSAQHEAARIGSAPMAYGEGGAVGKERGVTHEYGVMLGAETMHAH